MTVNTVLFVRTHTSHFTILQSQIGYGLISVNGNMLISSRFITVWESCLLRSYCRIRNCTCTGKHHRTTDVCAPRLVTGETKCIICCAAIGHFTEGGLSCTILPILLILLLIVRLILIHYLDIVCCKYVRLLFLVIDLVENSTGKGEGVGLREYSFFSLCPN